MGSVVYRIRTTYEITLYGVPCDGKIHNQELWDVVNMLFGNPGRQIGLPTRCPHIHEIEDVLTALSNDKRLYQWNVTIKRKVKHENLHTHIDIIPHSKRVQCA